MSDDEKPVSPHHSLLITRYSSLECRRWSCPPARRSVPTKSSACWARAEWGRCIGGAIRVSGATSPSRSCRAIRRKTRRRWGGSSVRRARSRRSRIRTSSPFTTSANSTARSSSSPNCSKVRRFAIACSRRACRGARRSTSARRSRKDSPPRTRDRSSIAT